MIKVTIGTTTKRDTKMYAPSKTLRNILEDNNIEYGIAQVTLDGVGIGLGDIDKSLSTLGITEKCMLIAVVKASNAK